MTEPFDPYRKWLGIPPEHQPPHHYRLLGIEPFESDTDVISNAADGRMAQLKTFQAGKFSQHSQRLLNEIAAAKVCLLHPGRKVEYDRQLRERGEGIAGDEGRGLGDEGRGLGTSVPSEGFGVRGSEDEDFPTIRPSAYLPRTSRKTSRWLAPLVLTVTAVALVVILAIWTENTRQITLQPNRAGPSAVDKAKAKPPEPAPLPELPDAAPAEPQPSEATPPEPSVLAVQKEPAESEPAVDEQPDEPAAEAPDEPKPPDAVEKLAVPGAAEQLAAETRIREIYGREFSAAKTADHKLALAAVLLRDGQATENNPAVRFVLLRLSCELAASAGEAAESLATVGKIAADFDLDPLAMKADVLAKGLEGVRGERQDGEFQPIIDLAVQLLDEAAAADNYELAGRIGRLAAAAARASKNQQTQRDVAARVREVDRLRGRFASIKSVLELLAEKPDEAEANLTAGQWYCFAKGDFSKGLALLAKGSDAELARLAADDLAGPEDTDRQAKLADCWWDLAEKETGPGKSHVQGRAAHWYRQAVGGLSGLEKTKVEKRLEAVEAGSTQPAGPSVRGAVRPGNLALAGNGTRVGGLGRNLAAMLDGMAVAPGRLTNAVAVAPYPCEWIIEFNKVYRLQVIRLLLWQPTPRFYRYALAVSEDGRNYTVVGDRSQGQHAGWQELRFAPRPVKFVKLVGLHNTGSNKFCVVEFEAYCVPPKEQPR